VTNYCKNLLTIEGSRQQLEVFARQCLSLRDGSYELDFEKILPVPPVLKGLRENAQDSPGLSRKRLAALEATDYRSEEDWVLHNWGFTPDRIEYQAKNLSETGYDAVFISPWGAPEGIFRAIAQRHPELTIRCAALEEGNDYSFRLVVEDGVITEGRPPITDAFIEEIEGPGEIENRLEFERPYYDEPATLRKQPLRHFRHWRNEARLKRALSGYPVYNPPRQGIAKMMPEMDARQNHEFFLTQKAVRLEVLSRLVHPFGVSLAFTQQTKDALDGWLATYAALLYVAEDGCSFLTHNPEWTDARLGLNVIFDLAIFLGEFAIHEKPVLRWAMDTKTEWGRTRIDDGFQRTVIAAGAQLFPFPWDVIRDTYDFCHARCEASYMWRKPLFIYGSRPLARQFVTKTLRYADLCARGDFATANAERAGDELAR
jgi:hypothetical protein